MKTPTCGNLVSVAWRSVLAGIHVVSNIVEVGTILERRSVTGVVLKHVANVVHLNSLFSRNSNVFGMSKLS